MQINLDPEQIQQILEILGTIGTGLIAFGGVWWKFSKWLNNKENFQKETNKILKDFGEVIQRLSDTNTVFTVKLEEREKDLMKLEGALEIQRRDMVGVITSLQKTAGSLDALWKTMQSVYPDKVPRRLSDKT
jgi:hypothetical protein